MLWACLQTMSPAAVAEYRRPVLEPACTIGAFDDHMPIGTLGSLN